MNITINGVTYHCKTLNDILYCYYKQTSRWFADYIPLQFREIPPRDRFPQRIPSRKVS